MPRIRRWPTLRRVQTLSPFGIGGIIDVSGESFAVADQTHWGTDGELIRLKRLEDTLGVNAFRAAPSMPDEQEDITNANAGVPVFRFPRWHFCPNCREMILLTLEDEQRLDPSTMASGRPVYAPAGPHRCPSEKCRSAKHVLVPMRFVSVCANGHLDDVDWPGWAHSDPSDKLCPDYQLKFEQRGVGGGLEALHVTCIACGATHSLEDVSNRRPHHRDAMDPPGGWKPYRADDETGSAGGCRGRQPWQPATFSVPRCNAVPVIVQRGGSNVMFPNLISALDIPPDSNHVVEDLTTIRTRIRSHAEYKNLIVYVKGWSKANEPSLATAHKEIMEKSITFIVDNLKDPSIISYDLVLKVASEEAGITNPVPAPSALPQDSPAVGDVGLRAGEFASFLGDPPPYHPRNRFQIQRVDRTPWSKSGTGLVLATLVANVVKATVLREVRVQRGFSRLVSVSALASAADSRRAGDRKPKQADPPYKFINYDGSEAIPQFVSSDRGLNLGWFPAVEVMGEGVFFSLNHVAVAKWRDGSEWVRTRINVVRERYVKATLGSGECSVIPEFILLHTLSHLVCQQLAFTCGYSLASLRERIYCGDAPDGTPMLGILIYTAAGDTEGSLGGLARQADAERFLDTIVGAITEARWCSSDPLCIEARAQGRNGLNLAACHGCALLPETSCEHFNQFLDRAMLVGDLGGANHKGFFSELVTSIDEGADSR